MRILRNILILFISLSVFGQTEAEINLNETLLKNLEKNTFEIVDGTNLYANDGSSDELFYYALKPEGKIIGTLILLPPTWQKVEDVINNHIKLSELAFERETNGFL